MNGVIHGTKVASMRCPSSQVCELFSKLAIAGAFDSWREISPGRSQGASGRDEFQILLRKFTCSPDPSKCCIGLAGIVCFAKCLSTAAASPDTPAAFQAQCLDSARELLDYGFSACKAAPSQHCHVMYTCLCDSLAALIASVKSFKPPCLTLLHQPEGCPSHPQLMIQGHLHPILLEHVRSLSLEEVQALLGDVDGEDVAPPLVQQVCCPGTIYHRYKSIVRLHAAVQLPPAPDMQRGLAQDHHAGHERQAVQYLNLNGAENGITYPVAQLVGAPDAASR